MNEKIYIVNVIVCVSVIIFCGVKVLLDPRPETTSIYLPVATGVCGYFVPNPKKDNKPNNNNEDNESLISRLSKRLIGGNKKQEQQEQVASNPSSSNSSDVLEV
jgi:hypothetical protein